MEKPDANGYVNVTWPSKNVPHGGIFHTRIANPSERDRQLIKVLLEESKLTLLQNQKNALKLRERDEQKVERLPQMRRPMVRPHTSRRRSLSEIRQSGVFDIDRYRPLKRGVDREQMKAKLAHTMLYGNSEEQPKPKFMPASMKKVEPKLPTNKDKWNELVTQIRERTEWLAEMEYLGHAAPHREIVKDQIAERLRALDALGIDSECSSTRSSKSGFSTLRSTEPVLEKPGSVPHSAQSKASTTRSKQTTKKQIVRVSGRPRAQEENVALYEQLSPLQNSPRRRQ